MSIVFGPNGGQFLTGGSGNLTLPDGDWCMAAMVYIDNHTGSERNSFLSAGPVGYVPELTFGTFLLQDPGSTPGSPVLRVHDGTNPVVQLRSVTGYDVPVGQWFLQVGQRSGGTKSLHIIPLGGAEVLVATSTATLGACSFGTVPMIGRRSCRQAAVDDCRNMRIAYIATGDFALSDAQRLQLSKGVTPVGVASWGMYLPFFRGAQSVYGAPIGGNVYTATGFPTTGTQPVRLW